MDYSNNYGGGGGAGGGYAGGYDNTGGAYGGGGGYDYGQQQQQEPVQQPYGVQARPMVDPEACGEVDVNLYPDAKEATHKVRGRYDFIEKYCGPIDQDLLAVKLFYFFFYSAFGSLFPLMGVYFKQMGMNPAQCGILIGMRPFVEFLSAPIWGSYADRWGQGKKLLLASLACWVIFTVPLGFIQPEAVKCIEKNNSEFIITTTRVKRDLSFVDDGLNGEQTLKRSRRSVVPFLDVGISPMHVRFAKNFDSKEHSDYVHPVFSSMVYRTPDIEKAFFLLLLVVLIGEFFSAPAITLADSAVITLLGDDADKYGQQRMFGSLGWGISMFLVGIALDHSTKFPNHPCGPERQEKNYNICFEIFTVLMTCAILCASQIPFKNAEPKPSDQQDDQQKQNQGGTTVDDEILAAQLNLPSLAAGGSGTTPTFGAKVNPAEQPELGAESKIFASTNKELPEWVTVLTHFKDLKCASFLFVAWWMGFGIGLIFTFLFWHLQDYGGSPTLFGVASVINHISEIFAYFFSFRLIAQIGHVKVLCLGLIGNVVRFLYISYLTNPWWVLPFELMQGITHAAVWAACCSYIAHNTPHHLRGSSQGVLQGIHHGLGRGCGAVIGGFFVKSYGTDNTFFGYGILCAVVLAAFVFINFYRKEQGFISEIPTTEDPRQVAEETSHLAPHGVPSNPIPRVLSNTRLNDVNGGQNGQGQGSSYGTYQTSGGNLDIPGAAKNPFAQ